MKKLQTILTILLAAALLTGCAASAATLSPQTPGTEPAAPKKLTQEEAAAIALEDAGLAAEDVTGLKIEYELDDGVPEYEVEFRSGDYEYDYHIHAESGAVRFLDRDYDPPRGTLPPETVPATAPPADAEPPAATEPPAAADTITEQKAVDIALERAGVNAADVSGLRVEYGIDDGIPEYEVEFCHGKQEYNCEIHARTGAVLAFECEVCDEGHKGCGH